MLFRSSQVPPTLRDRFLRGAAGRSSDLQRNSFPSSLSALVADTQHPLSVAIWASRAHAELPNVPHSVLRRLLASARMEEQVAGARLLSTVTDPPTDLVDSLPPIPASLAFRALSNRSAVPATAWSRWISALTLRTQANPRAWGNTWLALAESTPRSTELRSTLLAALPALRSIEFPDEIGRAHV